MKSIFIFPLAAVTAVCAACAGQNAPTPSAAGYQRIAHARPHSDASPTMRLIVGNTYEQGILSFDLPATGANVAPYQNITGSNTGLLGVRSVAVAPQGGIWASAIYGTGGCVGSTQYYDAPEFGANATGNATPIRVLNAQPYWPLGVTVDSGDHLWVAACSQGQGPAVLEYASGASGHATPIKIISGSNTGLMVPTSIALDSSGNIYVGNELSASNASILEFSSTASGNAAPTSDIQGSNTQLGGQLRQVSINASIYGQGDILVAELAPGSQGKVLEFGPGGSGNVGPFAVITSVASPGGVVADKSSGNIWVSAQGTNAVSEFGPDANGNATPIFSITGSDTELDGPANLVLRYF